MAITENGALRRDDNDSPVMGGVSSVDGVTIINSAFDPVTRRLLTDNAIGLSGTKIYYVSDSSGGAVTRRLTFTNGILTSES